MNICLFSEEEINKPLDLRDERGEHLVKILHKKTGDTFTAGIIGGMAGIATITGIEGDFKSGGKLTFTFEAKTEGKKLNPLKMIIGFPRPIQLKRLLRDIAGLGVCEVHLTGTELGEKSYMKSTLVEKGSAWKMLLDGTVQAGSTHVPALFMHETLQDCLSAIKNDSEQMMLLALDNINPKCSLVEAITEKKGGAGDCAGICSVAAIGSERGWTAKERELLEREGFIRCGMGERILRTETAATVAGAIILSQMKII